MNAVVHREEGRTEAGLDPVPSTLLRRRTPRLRADAPVIDNIARLLGAGAASRLIAEFGGGRLYIPENPSPGAPIAQAIGFVAARRLAGVFGGDRVWLPNNAGGALRARVASLRRRGLSISRIARQVGCSERYVYKVLARLREE